MGPFYRSYIKETLFSKLLALPEKLLFIIYFDPIRTKHDFGTTKKLHVLLSETPLMLVASLTCVP